MTWDGIAALLPLASLALGAVAAMLAAAFAPRTAIPWAAAGHLAALGLIVWRIDSSMAPSVLLADDGLARAGALLASLFGLSLLAFPFRQREAPAIVALAAAGAAAAAGATHAASLVLALETTTLATVALAALRGDRTAVEAAIKLMIPAGVAAAAMLLGFALVLGGTGSLELAGLGSGPGLPQLGAALLLFGLIFKFALIPTHMWAPDLFEGAPAQAVAVAGLLSKLAVALVLLRLVAALPEGHGLATLLGGLGAISFLGGNLVALRQNSLRRLLGWSSVAQSGLLAMLIGFGRGDGVGLALLFALVAYWPALLAALAAGRFEGQASADTGPLDRFGLLLGLVSLSGLPVAGGFIAKLLIIRELALASAWVAIALLILGSALGFLAYFRFVQRLVADRAGETPDPEAPPPPRPLLLVGASALILAIGLAPEPLAALLTRLAPAAASPALSLAPIAQLQAKNVQAPPMMAPSPPL